MPSSNNDFQHPSETTVFIFAAGRGARMLPLTANTPKPLLRVGAYSLIEHHLRRLAGMGFQHIVINVAYLAEQIINHIGSGERFNMEIEFSDESRTGALETAGGLKKALPKIRSNRFITINADVWTDFNFASLLSTSEKPAQLVLVDNPAHNPVGDFALTEDGGLSLTGMRLTFSGIACYEKCVFTELKEGKQALAPLLRKLIARNVIGGQHYTGDWQDIGTPERLNALQDTVAS